MDHVEFIERMVPAAARPIGGPTTLASGPASAPRELLRAEAARNPDGSAYRRRPGSVDPGRGSADTTWAEADREVSRLTAAFERLRLEPGARVGLVLPNTVEACLVLLALDGAGMTACPFDMTSDAAALSASIAAAGVSAVVTQAGAGSRDRTAAVCFVAAGFPGLRHVLGFGPSLPTGVVPLDRKIGTASVEDGTLHDAFRQGDILFGARDRRPGAEPAPCGSLIAAGRIVAAAAGLQRGHRVVSLLAPDDLRGLATGFAAALVCGAVLEPHDVFDAASLIEALQGPENVHLVAPGWLEGPLAESGSALALRSTVLVHAAPVVLERRPGLPGRVADVIAFDDVALLASPRDRGRPAFALGSGMPEVETRIDGDGSLSVRGPGVLEAGPDPDGWVRTRFRVDGRDGDVVAFRDQGA